MGLPEIIDWCIKLGIGGATLAGIQAYVVARNKRREQNTTLSLADKSEVSRVNQSFQELLKHQVNELLEVNTELREEFTQLQVKVAILEFQLAEEKKKNEKEITIL